MQASLSGIPRATTHWIACSGAGLYRPANAGLTAPHIRLYSDLEKSGFGRTLTQRIHKIFLTFVKLRDNTVIGYPLCRTEYGDS